MSARFRPPTPVPLAGLGGGGGGGSISYNNSSVTVVDNDTTNLGSVQISTAGKAAINVDTSQYVIIGDRQGITPTHRLTLVDSIGQCLQLINKTKGSLVNFLADSSSGLTVTTSGGSINFGTNNIYIGSNALYIGSTLVSSTATQLNYTNVTPGTATAVKALVVDSNRNIANINALVATTLTGTLQTGDQPNITTLNTVNISSLSIAGDKILSTASEINYLRGIIPGTATQNRALVLDSNSNITGIHSLSASSLVGTIQTSSQPNITTLGKLTSLSVNGLIAVGNHSPTRTIDILVDNPVFRMSNGAHHVELSLDGLGNYRINPDKDISISSHTNMLFSGTSSITGLNNLTANNLFGTLQTGNQPNITTIGALSELSVVGDVVIGSLSTASASRRFIVNEPNGKCITLARSNTIRSDISLNNQGDLELSLYNNLKILNGAAIVTTGAITGVTELIASSLTGTIQTAAQPKITSLGTLNSLSVANGIVADSVSASTLTGVITTAAQPNITSVGTLSTLSVANDLGAGSISAATITGTLQTAAQPKITSVGTLTSLIVSTSISAASIAASTIMGTIATSAQPNITSVGTLSNLNVLNGITADSIDVETITGTIETAAQPNITSVGTLTSLTVANALTASSVSASTLTGVIQTANQPNITSIGTLASLEVTNAITSGSIITSTIEGTLQTAVQPNITSIGTLNKLITSGPIGVGVFSPSSAIDINTSSMTGVIPSISLTDGTNDAYFEVTSNGLVVNTSGPYLTLGSGVGLRFINGSMTGLTNLTASFITGTLQTAAQPNITSVGKLVSLDTDFIGLGTDINQYRLNIHSSNGKMIMIANDTSSLVLSVLNNDFTLNTSNDRLALGPNVSLVLNGGTIIGLDNLSVNNISGVLTTPNQPNITSLGNLSSLTVAGGITANDATLQSATINGDLNVSGSLVLSTPLSFSNLNSSTLVLSGGVPATSITDGGTLTVNGGASFSDNVYVGNALTIGNTTLTPSLLSALSGLVPGIVNPNALLLADENKNLTGFNNLTAVNYYGLIQTSYQPAITTVGNLDNLNVVNYLGVGTLSPVKQVEINSLTGHCLRLTYDKANALTPAFLDFCVDATGSAKLKASTGGNITFLSPTKATQLSLGNTLESTMPLEVGHVLFTMTQPFAFNTDRNAHGITSASPTAPVTFCYSIRTAGRILCTGSVDVTSDRRTKENITELTDSYCTKFINSTQPVSFNWKDGDPNKSFGYVAQDIMKAGFPELINLAKDKTLKEEIDDDGFINPAGVKFTVSYQHIIPILAKNQRRLMKENEELKEKLDYVMQILKKHQLD